MGDLPNKRVVPFDPSLDGVSDIVGWEPIQGNWHLGMINADLGCAIVRVMIQRREGDEWVNDHDRPIILQNPSVAVACVRGNKIALVKRERFIGDRFPVVGGGLELTQKLKYAGGWEEQLSGLGRESWECPMGFMVSDDLPERDDSNGSTAQMDTVELATVIQAAARLTTNMMGVTVPGYCLPCTTGTIYVDTPYYGVPAYATMVELVTIPKGDHIMLLDPTEFIEAVRDGLVCNGPTLYTASLAGFAAGPPPRG